MTTETTALTLAEAVPLCHAFVARIAADVGVPILFFKGPMTTRLGLRPEHQSSDVDAFIRREDLVKLNKVLNTAGWKQRPLESNERAFPRTAATYFSENWPCDIDLHDSYLGLEADPGLVFDTFWQSRGYVEVAGHSIPTLSYDAHVLTTALHALRTPLRPRSVLELEHLVGVMKAGTGDSVIDLAKTVGGLAAARPFIESVFGGDQKIDFGIPSREWLLVSSASVSGSAQMMSLIETPWHHKFSTIWFALFPTRETLRAKNIRQDLSFLGMARTYIRRAIVAIHTLPDALRIVRQYRARSRR